MYPLIPSALHVPYDTLCLCLMSLTDVRYIYDTEVGRKMPSLEDYKYGVESLFIRLLTNSKFRTTVSHVHSYTIPSHTPCRLHTPHALYTLYTHPMPSTHSPHTPCPLHTLHTPHALYTLSTHPMPSTHTTHTPCPLHTLHTPTPHALYTHPMSSTHSTHTSCPLLTLHTLHALYTHYTHTMLSTHSLHTPFLSPFSPHRLMWAFL